MGRDPLTRGKRAVVLALLRNAKRRALKNGIAFDLTVADVHLPDFCPALGLPLFRAVGNRAQGPNSPTLDRLNPARGYVRGNVLVLSARANQIKSDSTAAELYRVATFFMQQEHL